MSTTPQGIPPIAVPLVFEPDDDTPTGPTVGASDAEADAAASGAPADLRHATRDSDGVPVGEADAEADRRASGA